MLKGKKFTLLVVLPLLSFLALIQGCTSISDNDSDNVIINITPENGRVFNHLDVTFAASVNISSYYKNKIEKVELFMSDNKDYLDYSVALKRYFENYRDPKCKVILGNNKLYYWKFKITFYSSIYNAVNDCCGVSYETPVSTVTAKGIDVFLLSPKDSSTVTANDVMQWKSVDLASKYVVYVSNNENDLAIISTDNESLKKVETKSSSISISDININPSNESYYWRVVAKNNEGHIIGISPIWSFKMQISSIKLYSPSNETTIYDPKPLLEWQNISSTSSDVTYDVYLSTNYNDVESMVDSALSKSGIRENSYRIENDLEFDKTYYWMVVAKNNENQIIGKSSIYSFKLEIAARINLLDFKTYQPNLISMFIQVYMHGYPATSLNTDDFVLKDDNEELAFLESYKGIKKKELMNYKFKTVIAVDVSGSISYDDLEKIKSSLKIIVDLMAPFQEIAIIKFADSPETVIDFTSDKEKLREAIDTIDRAPVGATDLYGAVIEGVNKWEDSFNIDEVEMGMLILLTDGVDTAKNHTLEEALEERGNKRIYTVGVGAEIDEDVLKRLGNEGYISIESFNQLINTLKKIQSYIVDFVSSFYLVYYLSPRRSGTHEMELSVAYTKISKEYDASNFNNPEVNIKALTISTDTSAATFVLQTFVKINSEEVKEFCFINPLYKPYGDFPEGLKYFLDVPEIGDYDIATLTLMFPEKSFTGTITILDYRYQVIKGFDVDLR